MSVNYSVRDHVIGTTGNGRVNLERHADLVDVAEKVSFVFAEILSNQRIADQGASLFVAMSHSAFLAAVGLALSGQSPPTYMAARGCLEAAIYAFWVTSHPDLLEIWKNREDNPEANKRARKAFEIGPMMKELDATQPAYANQFRFAYDATIGFGAHPNYLAYLTNLEENEAGDTHWMYVSTDRLTIRQALFAASHFGLAALAVIAQTFLDPIRASAAAQALVDAYEAWGKFPAPTEEA